MATKTYYNPIYRVTLDYPAQWKASSKASNRYEGERGFFQVSLISSKQSLEEVAQNDAFHSLLPYGSAPRIIPYEVEGHPARIILPSEDQPPTMDNQSAIIIKYETPVFIEPMLYGYLIIWVDVFHLRSLIKTIRLTPLT